MSDNVYKKLQQVRATLKTMPIKESGNNKFAGYQYMELGDFLPTIVGLCNDAGLCPVVSFADVATLTVVNVDAPEEQIIFTSPMSTADLKGCHAIQNLGAVETYLRRYLYVAAFDIVEHDALDSTQGKETKKEEKKEATGSTGSTQMTATQAEHFPRLQKALTTLCGDDKEKKAALCMEHTTFTGKDGKQVRGVEDYRKLDGQRLIILCHKIEGILPKQEKAEGKENAPTVADKIKGLLAQICGDDKEAKKALCDELSGVHNPFTLSEKDQETLVWLLEKKVTA